MRRRGARDGAWFCEDADGSFNCPGCHQQLTLVSVGNPHAIHYVDYDPISFPLERIGPLVENHPMFPRRTNFQVVQVLTRGHVKHRVWERGSGITLASGTSASAVCAASRLRGFTGDRIIDSLPGGDLELEWDGHGSVFMTGPATRVFDAEWLEGLTAMRARNQIRASLAFAHASGDAIIADCDESALYGPPGGNANTIGAIYLHAVFGEDFRFSQLVRAAPTVFATGGWANAVGIDLANPRLTADWAQLRFDRPAFRDYAQAVYAQTDATIAALSDEDLAREIRMGPVGNFTVASFTGDLLVFHFAAHMGEVAAIKGILGLKGLPF